MKSKEWPIKEEVEKASIKYTIDESYGVNMNPHIESAFINGVNWLKEYLSPASPLPISGDLKEMAKEASRYFYVGNGSDRIVEEVSNLREGHYTGFIAGHQARDVEIQDLRERKALGDIGMKALQEHNLKLTECLGELVKEVEDFYGTSSTPNIYRAITKAKSLIK